MRISQKSAWTVVFLLLWLVSAPVFAGPPFITDDPEPVEYQHWEVYLFSTYSHAGDGEIAEAPAVEVNYGVIPDVQLHLVTGGSYARPSGSPARFGLGDTELGAKYRFIHESDLIPQVGAFPLIEAPTGDSGRGLGNGQTQFFLPIWLQKSFGKDKEWTTFGGGGLWINPVRDHRNFFRVGWELQRDFSEHVTLGGEILHETSAVRGEPGHTAFNLGGYYNFDEHHHLLFSAGRDIDGPNHLSCYVGYQWTF